MSLINFNIGGAIGELPKIVHVNDGPIPPQFWYLDPQRPTERLVAHISDTGVMGGATLAWQDQRRGMYMPPPGVWEAALPGSQGGVIQPPDEVPLNIHYRLPQVRRTQNGYFVDEFGRRWIFKMCDGYPDFYHYLQGKDVLPRWRQRKALGFNGDRTFFSGAIENNGFWDIRTFDAAWLREADAFLKLRSAEGLYTEATFANNYAVNPTLAGQRKMYGDFWPMAATTGHVLGEYSNESEDGDNTVYKEVCVRVPGILLSSGSSQSDYPPPKPYLDWTGHHSGRGDLRNPDELAKCIDAMNLMHVQHGGWGGQGAGGHCVPVLNETQKAAQSAVVAQKPGSRTDIPIYFERLAAGARKFGGMTFASEAGGMYGILLEGPELTCAEGFIAGINGGDWAG